MAGSINKVFVLGNVGKDPEVRSTQSGSKIVNLTIATSDTWNDKASGERKEKTEWHRVVIFNERIADVAEKWVKKGSKIAVEGKLQTRKWTDQGGVDRYSTEIVIENFRGELTLISTPREDEGEAPRRQNQSSSKAATTRSPQPATTGAGNGGGWDNGGGDLDDEIPF